MSSIGHRISCIEIDKIKIRTLRGGKSTIHEQGLEPLIQESIASSNLSFYESLEETGEQFDVYFVAVGTPPLSDGSANLEYVFNSVDQVVNYANSDFLLVTKSTVPVGTGKKILDKIRAVTAKKNINGYYASNPEFLKEGVAVSDFMNPDRIVVGSNDNSSFDILKELYSGISNNSMQWIFGGIEDAEIIKYASNCFLATKISFINEVAQVCKHFESDVSIVAEGVGADSRISNKFLKAGCGYGGSCFPKDVDEFIALAQRCGISVPLLEAVPKVNIRQQNIPFDIVSDYYNRVGLKGKKIAVWGLSFKANTDDIRCSPSLAFISKAVNHGAIVKVYDPAANRNFSKWLAVNSLSDKVEIYNDKEAALFNAEALVIMTDWDEFNRFDFSYVKCINLLVDSRSIYNKDDIPMNINYFTCSSKRTIKSGYQAKSSSVDHMCSEPI